MSKDSIFRNLVMDTLHSAITGKKYTAGYTRIKDIHKPTTINNDKAEVKLKNKSQPNLIIMTITTDSHYDYNGKIKPNPMI